MQSLRISAPAKVNLFLGVGAAMPDGYHEVRTVLHTLELADTVTLTPADELALTCDVDLGIPARTDREFTCDPGEPSLRCVRPQGSAVNGPCAALPRSATTPRSRET